MGMFDVDDLTNKIDVGSQPGTMWSLSSQKAGHGIPELRDPDTMKMWQSDGLLPHLINVQFARRTVLTHISLYMDFKLDDSYTPNKVRIYAGTYYHDLVEVRTREFSEASGWKHFVLDKFDSRNESDDSDSDASSAGSSASSVPSSAELDETMSVLDHTAIGEASRRKGARREATGLPSDKGTHRRYLACGVSKRYAPIDAFLVQICIVSNHAAGKDSHLRGVRIFGPPTRQSRDKARSDARKQRESRKVTGKRATQLRMEREAKQRKRAFDHLRRWASAGQSEGEPVRTAEVASRPSEGGVTGAADDTGSRYDLEEASVPMSRGLQLRSSVR